MLKIGINGFGRIGRALFRINLIHKKYKIVVINDLDNDLNNLSYLLKYDSTYGKLFNNKIEVDKNLLFVNKQAINFYSKPEINKVPWDKHSVDIVIDSSGVYNNVKKSKIIANKTVKKIIITHSPKDIIDFTLMNGVNEGNYEKQNHHLISSSICDANAVAPFYKVINDNFGIEYGNITTLHPWLAYQNLLDGPLASVASPGHFWKDYALGRSSVNSLIPKATTLVSALSAVIPDTKETLKAISFRTPTSIVASANGTFLLKKETTLDEITKVLLKYCDRYKNVLSLDNRSLISLDYLGNEYAAIIDQRWITLQGGKLLNFVLWYDNEWGYSKRVYNLVEFLLNG